MALQNKTLDDLQELLKKTLENWHFFHENGILFAEQAAADLANDIRDEINYRECSFRA